VTTLSMLLKDIRIDSEGGLDPSKLPEAEAIERLRRDFGFLSSHLQISIDNGAATITLPAANAERADEALRLYKRAVKQADKGEYGRAIKFFQEVLSELPEHVDARRNLGMATLETGDTQHAKQYLLETIRLDPKDAWSHMLLGNIYLKHEKNYAEAAKYYQRAYELKPVDAILLANYGSLRIEQGRRDEAVRYFEEAIQADPGYPNSYYGLALLHFQAGGEEDSVRVLDAMLAQPGSGDRRQRAMYEMARGVCVRVLGRARGRRLKSRLGSLRLTVRLRGRGRWLWLG
jgi:tetratricopeptide (TPR) repeat protein